MFTAATESYNKNNASFNDKLNLRNLAVNSLQKNKIKILDAFAGDGILWDSIERKNTDISIERVSIDKKKTQAPNLLQGGNLKIIKSLNLSEFDIIDLDDYGVPIDLMQHLHAQAYKGIVIVTAITFGNLPITLTEVALGFPTKQHGTLYFRQSFKDLMLSYLKIKQATDIKMITLKQQLTKLLFSYRMV